VPSPVLVQVVTAAGHRCECTRTGCHGRADRCGRGLPAHRLVAAPRDITVPAHAAWRVPVAELAAWCDRCHEHGQTAGRRARSTALAEAAAAVVLPLDLGPVTP
jgi:hypothetical protein